MSEQTPAETEQQPRQNGSRRQSVFNVLYPPLLTVVLGAAMFGTAAAILPHVKRTRTAAPAAQTVSAADSTAAAAEPAFSETTTTVTEITAPEPEPVTAEAVDSSLVVARNAVLLKLNDTGAVTVFDRGADEKIYPASMTKIMTLLTFLDLIPAEKLDDIIRMDANVLASQQAQYAYVAGFAAGEDCKIRDLVFAMMLPSGADAAVMLATYAAGSEEAFVAKMNEKAQAMGLTQTHFVNCTGLHNDAHTSSVREIALILTEALKDPFCKEVMSTKKHTTAATPQHPNGIELVSTTLSRLVGNELEQMSVPLHLIGGKTGFTNPAGQCLATWAQDAQLNTYICVIAGSTTNEPLDAMGDTLTLYQLISEPAATISRIRPQAANLPDYVHN